MPSCDKVNTPQTNQQMQHATVRGWGGSDRDEESFLDQLTECLCPIPIITYPQDVLLAVQRAPQQKKEEGGQPQHKHKV